MVSTAVATSKLLHDLQAGHVALDRDEVTTRKRLPSTPPTRERAVPARPKTLSIPRPPTRIASPTRKPTPTAIQPAFYLVSIVIPIKTAAPTIAAMNPTGCPSGAARGTQIADELFRPYRIDRCHAPATMSDLIGSGPGGITVGTKDDPSIDAFYGAVDGDAPATEVAYASF